jgi:hypothetical protein
MNDDDLQRLVRVGALWNNNYWNGARARFTRRPGPAMPAGVRPVPAGGPASRFARAANGRLEILTILRALGANLDLSSVSQGLDNRKLDWVQYGGTVRDRSL